MPQVDPVILQLKAEVADYNAKVDGAQKNTDRKLDMIEKRGFQMGQRLKSGFNLASAAAVAFAGSMVVDKVVQAISTGLEYASSLGEVAQQLGVTTDQLQEYRYAASQAGVSNEEMDQALSQLTRRIGEAKDGTGAQAEAFKKLGISAQDANGNLIATGDAIPMIADALQRIKSPAERAAILMDLFGRSGQKLEALLAGGSAAVNNLRNAAHSLGIVLSSEQIQRADDVADKLSALKQVLEANIAGAVSNNAQAILGLANSLAQVVVWAGKAATAFQVWKLQVAARQEQSRADGWFTSGAESAKAQSNANRLNAEAARLEGTQDKTGGFRDYRAAPIPGLKGSGGSAMPAVAGGAGGGNAKAPKGGGGGSGGAGGGASGPSAAETAHRLDSQLASYAQQAISAMQSVARSTDEKAELELRSVELARIRVLADIKTDKDYSAAQKARLVEQVEVLAEAERERVEFQRRAQTERDLADVSDARHSAEADALKQQIDLADSNSERRQLAFDLLDLEYRYQKSLLETVIASETASEVEMKRAQIALNGLNAAQAGNRAQVGRANETPGQSYLRDLNTEAANLGDAFEEATTRGLDKLNDSLSDTVKKTLHLHGILGDIVGDFIEIAIRQQFIKPLAESLFGGGGGGGGIFGAIGGLLGIGGPTNLLPGRASGGYVAPGQMVRVNEGASPGRVEAFMSRDGGSIIPLGRMNAMQGGAQQGGMATVRLELSGDIDARIQKVSGPVAVEVVRASAPTIIKAASQETMMRSRRPSL